MSQDIFIGGAKMKVPSPAVQGSMATIDGEDFYKIADYDSMRPFFMTVVSHSDHWLFISSKGGLTAGRKNENSSLFPYYTDDKIADSFEYSGCKTIFKVHRNGKIFLWEPFSDRNKGIYILKRNLYKNVIGNHIIFEEKNEDLELVFNYSWQFSEKYGFVRKVSLVNKGNDQVTLDVLDGFQNILPYGINSQLQNERSNLVNAYKKNELEQEAGLGLFMLSSIIVDRAEPSEALKATTVWSSGIEPQGYLLSQRQLDHFRSGINIQTETDVKAEPGSYFIHKIADLKPGSELNWQFVAELNQDHTTVNNLIKVLTDDKQQVLKELEDDLREGTNKLIQLVGAADGLQHTNDKLICGRHYTNVMFNIMRGGIFDEGYDIDTSDYADYVRSVNRDVFRGQSDYFKSLPDRITYQELLAITRRTSNNDLIRIFYEYLPLTFSRRHGDPSRPWNKFSIETRKEDGSKNLNYQGNWRDIFQNWEALALSYPMYINSMISKFVNASTIDGYNPYRIMRTGIDWEVIEPDDPWSYIGYWGDHQIIYLLKLLEISFEHTREELLQFLAEPIFVYANVPYSIKPYADILKDPQDTIDFDHAREALVEDRVARLGADGKMIFVSDKELLKATLTEKLLVSLLAKLSNFIPEGGIWLNTQRPEWNDANNALVGNGVSMVTLYYIRRFLSFLKKLIEESGSDSFEVHDPVSELMKSIQGCLEDFKNHLEGPVSDHDRKSIMDRLGLAGESYRAKGYSGFQGSEKAVLRKVELLDFIDLVTRYTDHSIKSNKRNDGLYHSYNIIQIQDDKAAVEYLYEMLEGQVAVLSSGALDTNETLEILDALRNSPVYRKDQYSYLLYPDRELPRFLEKNNIPQSFIESSELANVLIRNNDTSFLTRDANGICHFNGSFTNANGLKAALDKLAETSYKELVEKEYHKYLKVYEDMFNHKAFTGRSGTFFGYEGLGSIYWHMVSKLLLAIQENLYHALDISANEAAIDKLIDHYYKVREGIGVHKSPELYGAFSTDPYSHTPGNKGAQQPGMTGQVKEDILNRWAELGVMVRNGCLSFKPSFLTPEEFLERGSGFDFYDVEGQAQNLQIEKDELVFTYCQVPVIYRRSGGTERIKLELENGEGSAAIEGLTLPEDLSKEIFDRTGRIRLIRVDLSSG